MKMLLILFLLQSASFSAVQELLLVVGNNVGLGDELTLRYADADAKRVYETLVELGGVDKERAYLLLNQSKGTILLTFREVAGRVKELKKQGEQVEVFVYYSGHGDDNAFHIQGEELPLSAVREFFNGMDADLKILVADACQSGALLSAKGGKVGNAFDLKWKNDLSVKGSVILTSSSAGELSHESRDLEGSLFTYYLVSGLRGAADFDHDKTVSLWEGFSYTQRNISRHEASGRNGSQTPGFDFNIRGTENIALTHLSTGKAFLVFKSCKPGRYRIFDGKSGHSPAEVILSSDDSLVTLALPIGQYIVQRPEQRVVYMADADLTWGGTREIIPQLLKPHPVDALTGKGGRALKYKPNSIGVTTWLSKDFAYHDGILGVSGMSYSREGFWLGGTIGVGYGSDKISGQYLTVDRKFFRIHSELRYYPVQKSRYALFLSGSGAMIILQQNSTRPDEASIRLAGYPAIPMSYGQYGLFGLGLGGKINLPWSFVLSAGTEAALSISRTLTNTIDYAWQVPIGLTLAWKI